MLILRKCVRKKKTLTESRDRTQFVWVKTQSGAVMPRSSEEKKMVNIVIK